MCALRLERCFGRGFYLSKTYQEPIPWLRLRPSPPQEDFLNIFLLSFFLANSTLYKPLILVLFLNPSFPFHHLRTRRCRTTLQLSTLLSLDCRCLHAKSRHHLHSVGHLRRPRRRRERTVLRLVDVRFAHLRRSGHCHESSNWARICALFFILWILLASSFGKGFVSGFVRIVLPAAVVRVCWPCCPQNNMRACFVIGYAAAILFVRFRSLS